MGIPVEECRVRLSPGDDVQAALAGGGVVCFAPGIYPGAWTLSTSVTLRGEAGAVLDAAGAGSVLLISENELAVRVEGLTLRNGHNEVGGALWLGGYSDVTLIRCVIERSRGSQAGGAVFAGAGRLTVSDSQFRDNRGNFGQDLIATGVAEVSVKASQFASDIAAREGATLTLTEATVAGTVDVRGTTTRGPIVRIVGGSVPRVANDADVPGAITRE